MENDVKDNDRTEPLLAVDDRHHVAGKFSVEWRCRRHQGITAHRDDRAQKAHRRAIADQPFESERRILEQASDMTTVPRIATLVGRDEATLPLACQKIMNALGFGAENLRDIHRQIRGKRPVWTVLRR